MLTAAARDPGLAPDRRLRALWLLRPLSWRFPAVRLEIRDEVGSSRLDGELDAWVRLRARVSQRPEPALGSWIATLLPTVPREARARIAFVLRTCAG